MIFNHLTIGSDDIAASRSFYDPVLATLGIVNLGGVPDAVLLYGRESPQLFVMRPRDGGAASVGNGVTIALKAPDQAAVDAFHAAGCVNGGLSEGAPGTRAEGPPGNYVAYLRDPVGNKLAAVTYGA